jgi:hypothetical protein
LIQDSQRLTIDLDDASNRGSTSKLLVKHKIVGERD